MESNLSDCIAMTKKQSGQFLHATQDIYPISQYTDVKKLSSMSQGLMG